MSTTTPADGERHVTVALEGSVISHETAPVGAAAKLYPVTVVVNVVVPPSVGLAEAATVIPGVCLRIVKISGSLETVR